MKQPKDFTVLVVEDEPDVRLFLETALDDAGFNVIGAADGEEALNIIKEKRPDFISLDLILPRRTGPKLIHELNRDKELSKIPILIVTAHAKTDLGEHALEELLESGTMSGPGAYLEKPVKASTYVRSIQKALGIEETTFPESKVGLKEELHDALQGASSEALQKALKALREK